MVGHCNICRATCPACEEKERRKREMKSGKAYIFKGPDPDVFFKKQKEKAEGQTFEEHNQTKWN